MLEIKYIISFSRFCTSKIINKFIITIILNSQTTASVEKQIIAYLDSHFVNKPRFRQRPVMIVKFEQGQIASDMDPFTATMSSND